MHKSFGAGFRQQLVTGVFLSGFDIYYVVFSGWRKNSESWDWGKLDSCFRIFWNNARLIYIFMCSPWMYFCETPQMRTPHINQLCCVLFQLNMISWLDNLQESLHLRCVKGSYLKWNLNMSLLTETFAKPWDLLLR